MLSFLPFARRSRRWRRRRRRRFGRNFPSWRRCRWSRWQRPEKKKKSNLQVRAHFNLSWESVIANNQLFSLKSCPKSGRTKRQRNQKWSELSILLWFSVRKIFSSKFFAEKLSKKNLSRVEISQFKEKLWIHNFFYIMGPRRFSSFGDSDATGGTNARNGFEKMVCVWAKKARVCESVCACGHVRERERERERAREHKIYLKRSFKKHCVFCFCLSHSICTLTHTRTHTCIRVARTITQIHSSAYGLSTLTESLKIKWFFFLYFLKAYF